VKKQKNDLAPPDFRTLFETAPGCYLVLDPRLAIVAVSDAYLKATMTRRENILGRNLFEVFPDNPDDPAATGTQNLRASLEYVLKHAAPHTMAVQKYDIRKPDSEGGGFEERYWSPKNLPAFDENKKIAYLIHCVEDVTELVHLKQRSAKRDAAEALTVKTEQEIQKKILDSEIFLESIVENIPNMVFVKDGETLRFTLMNKAAEKLLGYSRTELLGKNDYDFFPKDQADFFVESDRNVLRGTDVLDIEDEPVQTRTQGVRHLHTKKIPIRDSEGRSRYLLGISEDITDKKRAEEEIRNLNLTLQKNIHELEAVNKELESFSYSVSHDLRAPLRGMNGFAAILAKDFDKLSENERNDYLQRIVRGAAKMGRLIDSLLDLSRLTRREMRREPVDLSAMTKTIVDELKAAHPVRTTTVVVQENLTATGDAPLLQAALQNLLHNAWKFSSSTANARIEFGSYRGDTNTVFFVRDNGVGFDPQYQDKLFGPFQRLHTDREFDGDGIGLATVQRVIHRHGGRIWAESQPGKGATFYFTLA
jgi:PAS domain S-box-containing protein